MTFMEQLQSLLPEHVLEKSEDGLIIFDGRTTPFVWQTEEKLNELNESSVKDVHATMTEIHGDWQTPYMKAFYDELLRWYNG